MLEGKAGGGEEMVHQTARRRDEDVYEALATCRVDKLALLLSDRRLTHHGLDAAGAWSGGACAHVRIHASWSVVMLPVVVLLGVPQSDEESRGTGTPACRAAP